MPPGVILPYGGSSAPTGFLMCDGAAVSETTYAALFAVIGHSFGGDPGGGNFYVPNLQGVSPTGVGAQDINARTKAGPALGEVREDQEQDHLHLQGYGAGGGSVSRYGEVTGLGSVNGQPDFDAGVAGRTTAAKTSQEYDDGTNGTPRTGAYTHGPEIGVRFIIKT